MVIAVFVRITVVSILVFVVEVVIIVEIACVESIGWFVAA